MRQRSFLIVAAAVVVFASLSSQAAEIKVIANPSVTATSISADELKNVFLETTNSLKGGHVEPVLVKGGAAHEVFVKEYLGKSDAALQTYYRSLVFTGKASMPKVLSSEAEVVTYVAKTKGAIGYVGPEAGTAGVKTLQVQ